MYFSYKKFKKIWLQKIKISFNKPIDSIRKMTTFELQIAKYFPTSDDLESSICEAIVTETARELVFIWQAQKDFVPHDLVTSWSILYDFDKLYCTTQKTIILSLVRIYIRAYQIARKDSETSTLK